ncbi:putative ribonuclease H-like domain-containing protein [Tanacetum coccineum]
MRLTLTILDRMSEVVIYYFFAKQSNNPQLDNKDLQQIDADDLEEMDLKWQMAMVTIRAKRFLKNTGWKVCANGSKTIGFDKTKVDVINCQKGSFCKGSVGLTRRNRNREPVRRNVIVETTETKALVAQDGLGYDWSDQAEEGPTNFALMAYTSSGSSSSSSSDSEVSTCSKACLKSYETLKEHYDNLTKDFNKSQLNVGAYKVGLESVEARTNDVYKRMRVVLDDVDIKILKLDIKLRDNALIELRKKFEKAEKERDDLKLTLEKFGNSSKNLSKLLEIQVSDKFKTGVGFDSQVVDSHVFDSQENDRYKTSEGYHVVPPPYTRNFMPLKYDLVLADEGEYVFSESVTSIPDVATSEAKTSVSKPKSVGEPLIEDWISDSEDENETKFKSKQRKPSFAKTEFVKSNEHVKTTSESVKKVENKKQAKYPRKNSQSPRVVSDSKGYEANVVKASTCWVWRPKQKVLDHVSRYNGASMNFKRFDYVDAQADPVVMAWVPRRGLFFAFMQGNPPLELQEKGVIDNGCSRHMTGNKSYLLDYEEIDGGFIAFGGDPKGGEFMVKLLDENHVLLRVPRKDNMYSVDLKNICSLGGRKPALSFMRPFGCPVTILNTLDHLGKFDGKADEGFFVRYFTNSKAYREIDLISMNYKPVVVENQSNGSVGKKACDDALKARMETVPGKDYILLPFLTQDLSLSSSSKDSPGAGFKPSGEEEKKDAKDLENKDSEVPNIEEPRVNQEQDANVNSTSNINTVSLTINVADIENNAADENIVYECDVDPNMPNLEEIVYSDDDEGVDAKVGMTNLDINILISPTLTTRIHKDHPLEQIIIDIHLAPQTRRMTKNVTEHVEPKKVIQALQDPSWIEAMQEELLQFKLQQVWTLMDLPHGKRAIGTKWVYMNKKDERGIVIRNKARLVAQGYTQEEGIDYDEVFAPVAKIEAIRLFLAYASFKNFVVYQIDIKSSFLYGKID